MDWNRCSELTAIYYGRRPQMSCLRGHIHPPSTCRPTHAFPCVRCLCSTPSLTFVSDTGDRPYKCQYCGDQFARRCAPCFVLLQSPNSVLSVTSYQDTLTNVTQTKNRCPLRVLVKKVLFRLHGPLPQNRSVTSVFRQTLLAMVPILVVCPFPPFPLFFYY